MNDYSIDTETGSPSGLRPPFIGIDSQAKSPRASRRTPYANVAGPQTRQTGMAFTMSLQQILQV